MKSTQNFISRFYMDSEYEGTYTIKELYRKNDLDRDYIVELTQIGDTLLTKEVLGIVRVPYNYDFTL
jgi:hypothetical protein